VAAAKVLGLSQPNVSALFNGELQGYSQERLIGLLNRLRCDVKIVVTPKPRSRAMRPTCPPPDSPATVTWLVCGR